MEKWDLYSVDRAKTGRTINRGEKVPTGYYRLVVHVFIFNSEGKMLIQQRQDGRDLWPSLWDFSVGGSVQAGEDTRQAGERECREELGYSISLKEKAPAFTFTFEGGYDDVYVLCEDIDLSCLALQEEEVQAIRWADEEEVNVLYRAGKFIPYLESYIHYLFERSRYTNNFLHL